MLDCNINNDFDPRTFVRIGLIVIAFISAFFIRLISGRIGSSAFKNLINRCFLFFIIIVVARIISTVIDAQLDLQLGIASSIVSYAYNLYVMYLIIRYWYDLKYQKSHIDRNGLLMDNPRFIDTTTASPKLDEALRLLRLGDQKIENLKRGLENHKTK